MYRKQQKNQRLVFHLENVSATLSFLYHDKYFLEGLCDFLETINVLLKAGRAVKRVKKKI